MIDHADMVHHKWNALASFCAMQYNSDVCYLPKKMMHRDWVTRDGCARTMRSSIKFVLEMSRVLYSLKQFSSLENCTTLRLGRSCVLNIIGHIVIVPGRLRLSWIKSTYATSR